MTATLKLNTTTECFGLPAAVIAAAPMPVVVTWEIGGREWRTDIVVEEASRIHVSPGVVECELVMRMNVPR